MSKDKVSIFIMVLLLVMAASMAFGASVPTAGSYAYEAHDIVSNKIIGGPIGYVISIGLVVFGAIMLGVGQPKVALYAMTGGGLFLGSNAIVSTMGILY
ncbi:hypothetical protein ADMFC3_00350 [Geovibrio sp. ADMFC3]